MFNGIIGGLLVAWILELFGFGTMVLEVFQPMVSVELTLSHYYVAFAILGIIFAMLGLDL